MVYIGPWGTGLYQRYKRGCEEKFPACGRVNQERKVHWVTSGLLKECLSGPVDSIQVGQVQVEQQSIFTLGFNGHFCDSHRRVIIRLVSQVDLCVFQEELLAYIPSHTFQIRSVSDRVS